VPFDGWSWRALRAGRIDAGYDDMAEKLAFPDGLGDAARHFADWSDRRMLTALQGLDLDSMRVRDRIHTCVQTRLSLNTPYRDALRRLMSFLALPHNAALSTRITWQTCSEMWYAAGDTATDWNHYTKRGLLASVYITTLLYWLSDSGDKDGDFPDTWAFLGRRIDNILKFSQLTRKLNC
jgi:ubiquinone biosynthesis protein COQ9